MFATSGCRLAYIVLMGWGLLGIDGTARAQFMRQPPDPGTIHRAAFDGDLKTVQKMLAANKGLLEKHYGKYGTPLHTAAGSGYPEIVRYLIRQGADAKTAKTIGDNESALMSASVVYPGQSETIKLEIVKLLVAKGANVKARDRNKMTALHYAASTGAADIVAYLVAHGAEVNAKTNADMTPLHYAAGYAPMGDKAIRTVKYLLSKGADKTVKFQGQSLMEYISRAKRPQMAAVLRQAGAK